MSTRATPPLPASELERRRKALENARTANRLEGVAPSRAVCAIMELWASGQISDDEMDARAAAQLEAESREAAGEGEDGEPVR